MPGRGVHPEDSAVPVPAGGRTLHKEDLCNKTAQRCSLKARIYWMN
uniref:ASNSD1 upstream open reading frame n=1 Tax=Oryctolagus cuniculus TaxID=9986 RepID=A0A5F9CC12_RABIT